MKLTSHTDFGLRVLMTLAVFPDRLVTVEELAVRHRVSRHHLMKVAQSLIHAGFVDGVRGRNGGLRLAKAPADVRVGDVVRRLEDDMVLVPCLGTGEVSCLLAGACKLTSAMSWALQAFLAELDVVTLMDLAGRRAATASGLSGRLATDTEGAAERRLQHAFREP